MQRPAKPSTPVRFRPPPPKHYCSVLGCGCVICCLVVLISVARVVKLVGWITDPTKTGVVCCVVPKELLDAVLFSARVVKLVDTTDLKSVAYRDRGVPVRFRFRVPKFTAFYRVY
jgi:hypothetical protein